jgi:hypothetical protein
MTSYTLNVVIDNAILAYGSMDSLCIAKKVRSSPGRRAFSAQLLITAEQVNGTYNVIFQGASPVPKPDQQLLVSNNTFAWIDEYQVFLTNSFGNGVFVSHPASISSFTFAVTHQFMTDEFRGKSFLVTEILHVSWPLPFKVSYQLLTSSQIDPRLH